VIPDPEALAANLGVGTLVLIVGGERTFLVAITGSSQIKARMIDAYQKAGLPVQIAADVGPPGRAHHGPPDLGAPKPKISELAVRRGVGLSEDGTIPAGASEGAR
jgi:hypothetical protein